MNSEAIQYSSRPTINTRVSAINWIRGLFVRRQAKANALPAQASARQGDLLRSLPVEEKLRLGMYHFMD